MNTFEYFQNNNSNESDLNSAYNSESLNDSMHNIPFCNANNSNNNANNNNNNNNNNNDTNNSANNKKKIEKSTINNLWDFLGFSNLSTENKECLFDCSIRGARCLERCKYTNPEKCKYRCLKHGLY